MVGDISVIIPCHNAAPWIGEAVRSLLGQTVRPREVLVIDDGSEDASREVVKKVADSSVRLLLQRRMGQSAAANHGLAEAKGRYIKFLDADDLLGPLSLETQSRALRENPGHIAAGICRRFVHDPKEARFPAATGTIRFEPVDWLVRNWQDGQPMMQCGIFLMERSLLERTGGWREELSLINDFEFFSRVIAASEGLIETPSARVYYRSALPGSLSSRKSREAWVSAHRSVLDGTATLLKLESSHRTRQVVARCLEDTAHQMAPFAPDLASDLAARIRLLGIQMRLPRGSLGFRFTCLLLGWRRGRSVQEWVRHLKRNLRKG